MLATIRNVYCVGRNYKLHAEELGNAVPKSPMIFMKPTHALVPMDGGDIVLPGGYGQVHYEAELVVRIGAAYERGMKAAALVSDFALGIDFTLRDLQEELKQKQHPWLKAKGFRAAAPLTRFLPAAGTEILEAASFSLRINDDEVQRGHVRDMIFDVQTLIDHIGGHYGLAEGDVIYTGTPAGVGRIADGDRMALYWGEEQLGSCRVCLA
ncbi:FAA hydrolase family protein [Xylanibacillus composti]|uniref:Fumarylacetoacetate hydrolase n=1 Tax=Xylanibacillus composti TaxID=1572762 RepID=A0A8J4M3E8_9BACL|nr:fumarylacetoacetate hydrolase family protein [Xylanibacillus composti]MDT9726478.1 FAA hydrolase family protein [Xylanibacillus composti]GIQ69952.1 fumarylacetoacetate hydrolase [Xylanibacillus composti]